MRGKLWRVVKGMYESSRSAVLPDREKGKGRQGDGHCISGLWCEVQ